MKMTGILWDQRHGKTRVWFEGNADQARDLFNVAVKGRGDSLMGDRIGLTQQRVVGGKLHERVVDIRYKGEL